MQGREPYLCDFVKKKKKKKKHFNVGLYSSIYRAISFKLDTKLYIFMLVWMTLTFIQGNSCFEETETWVSVFSESLLLIWIKFCMLPQPVGLLKLMLNSFCASNSQGREL